MGSVADLLHHDPIDEDDDVEPKTHPPLDAVLRDGDKDDDRSPASPVDHVVSADGDNLAELPRGYVLESLGKLLLRDDDSAALRFPIGFRSCRLFRSYVNVQSECKYTSQIVENETGGGLFPGQPVSFRVTCADDPSHPVERRCATEAWKEIIKRFPRKGVIAGAAVDGYERFGLRDAAVQAALKAVATNEAEAGSMLGLTGFFTAGFRQRFAAARGFGEHRPNHSLGSHSGAKVRRPTAPQSSPGYRVLVGPMPRQGLVARKRAKASHPSIPSRAMPPALHVSRSGAGV